MIAVVDSGISNLGSVCAALTHIGAAFTVTAAPQGLHEATGLLLPGVGAFGDGMAALRDHELVEPIRAYAASGKPVLGICLGMQLLAERSEEFGDHEGLGIIPGRARRLQPSAGFRVPNIGWCPMRPKHGCPLFADTPDGASFYFVHSYALECADPADVAGTIAFAQDDVTVAVQRGNIFGAQFHPEKSQDFGLAILDSFARITGDVR